MNFFLRYLEKGESRSVKIKKNIAYMLLIKGGNIVIGLLLVPITLDYVDSEKYGIWLTISTMIAWIHFFDIGINNGLKNRLTEAIANNDNVLAKKYVSTTYALLFIIFIPLMIILLCITPFLNWNRLLMIGEIGENLIIPVSIIIIYFCFYFILSTINTVILADQRPADSSLRQFLQQLFSLLIIYLLTKTTNGSLLHLCIGLCVSPLLVLSIFNYTLFRGRYKVFAPSLKFIDFKVAPDLMKLGVQFFIIQIAGVVQYQMINFLIIRNYGASDVAAYNIAFKYFSILTMIWGILTTPIWAAVTDAIANNDYIWIVRTQRKYMSLLFLFYLLGVLMLLVSHEVYDFWVASKVSIPFMLSMWVMLYTFSTMFSGIFVSVLNGSGELKIQTIACVISPILFLFSFFGMKNSGCGVHSIMVAAIVSNFNGLLLAPIQCYFFLKRGLCNKY